MDNETKNIIENHIKNNEVCLLLVTGLLYPNYMLKRNL